MTAEKSAVARLTRRDVVRAAMAKIKDKLLQRVAKDQAVVDDLRKQARDLENDVKDDIHKYVNEQNHCWLDSVNAAIQCRLPNAVVSFSIGNAVRDGDLIHMHLMVCNPTGYCKLPDKLIKRQDKAYEDAKNLRAQADELARSTQNLRFYSEHCRFDDAQAHRYVVSELLSELDGKAQEHVDALVECLSDAMEKLYNDRKP